jgi:hypothetical protein
MNATNIPLLGDEGFTTEVVSETPIPSADAVPCATKGGGHSVDDTVMPVRAAASGTLTYVSAPCALLQLAKLTLVMPDVIGNEMLMSYWRPPPAVGKGPSTRPSTAPAP